MGTDGVVSQVGVMMEACGGLLLISYKHVFFRFSEDRDCHATLLVESFRASRLMLTLSSGMNYQTCHCSMALSLVPRLTDAPSQSLSLPCLTVVL